MQPAVGNSIARFRGLQEWVIVHVAADFAQRRIFRRPLTFAYQRVTKISIPQIPRGPEMIQREGPQ